MNLVLFDNEQREALFPLTFTRPQAAIRSGILTIKEKWEHYLRINGSYLTTAAIALKYPLAVTSDTFYIAGNLLPNGELVAAIQSLKFGEGITKEGNLLAIRADEKACQKIQINDFSDWQLSDWKAPVVQICYAHQLLPINKKEIDSDFLLLTEGRRSQEISETVTLVGEHKNPECRNRIFIEAGAEVEYAWLNPQEGPIYIGKNAIIQEGAMLRGPIALCESAQINMGAKIYGGATIGPRTKVGGEMSNSIILGYSNKVHDGYLGDSVLGEWCNLGADTNTSNLKNDYAEVKLWDYTKGRFQKTGLQFCGLIMGDYSRCAINTAFNSGTVVGIGTNIFGSGFPRNFVPSFVIGGPQGYKSNASVIVKRTAKMAMQRRNVDFSQADDAIIDEVFESTQKYRSSFR
ncbi:MAG: glucose-1-phosphate thymidylyltransferase [Marinilabiliaceae bacterium]|nr:glucose-1-phosphate thymidylyltransferase [Marinilabiliaceae bacterium]